MMRFSLSIFVASLLACSAASAPAWAEVQNGTEVTVNPVAGGNDTLLYPGGQYMRVVRPLLQPGEKPGPVRLHMPVKRAASRAPASQSAVAAPAPQAAPVKPAPAPPRRVAAAPAPASPGGFFNPGFGAAGLELAAPPAKQQIAKAEPPPAATPVPAGPGLSKRSVILFAAEASDPAESALGAIRAMAGDLNTAMTGPASRIQILAYGGVKGDKGSDARRLSLKRALSIRQVLIDDGVDSRRIDVRAMGGADDGGPPDRVDVYVKA